MKTDNNYLNAQNTEAFTDDNRIKTPLLLDKIKKGEPRVPQWDTPTVKNNKGQKKIKTLDTKKKA